MNKHRLNFVLVCNLLPKAVFSPFLLMCSIQAKSSLNFLVKFVFVMQMLSNRIVLTLYHTIHNVMTREKKTFENIVGKGENAGNQYFLLFPQCFLPFPKQISIFDTYLNALHLDISKVLVVLSCSVPHDKILDCSEMRANTDKLLRL